MLPRFLLFIFGISLISLTVFGISLDHYQTNSSLRSNKIDATPINNNGGAKCDSFLFCHLMRKKIESKDIENYLTHRSIPSEQRFDPTTLQARSYYNYGGNASPAIYPAFDSLSILASLAFLAFILQSFASLFDRSRSMIPAIVSSRSSTQQFQSPDPIKLIMRALDEYEILSDDIILNDEKKRRKKFH